MPISSREVEFFMVQFGRNICHIDIGSINKKTFHTVIDYSVVQVKLENNATYKYDEEENKKDNSI